MAASVPDTIEIRMCARVVPPAAFVEMSAVSCGIEKSVNLSVQRGEMLKISRHFHVLIISRDFLALHVMLWSYQLLLLPKLCVLL